ncbi:unnamed protein product [Bursaphelenchus xylophilus]|nr:unnamed protein product [Bursaphelenchus xylophilus]CAG9089901.1 unnamed protein product [Bursaphelenchus xylophilus]
MTSPDLTGFLEDPSLTLHFLAYDKSPKALETVKYLLDVGKFDVNLKESQDLLTPLHIAAHWDNLAMCQLLIHYGANPLSFSSDDQCPVDLATGKSKEFLQKLSNKRGHRKKQRKLLKFIRHVFQPHKTKPAKQLARPPSAPPSFFSRLDGQEPITDQVFTAVTKRNERTSNQSDRTFFTATEGRGRTLSMASERSFVSAPQSTRNSVVLNQNPVFLDFEASPNITMEEANHTRIVPTAPPFSPDATPIANRRVNNGEGDQTPIPAPRNASLLDKNVTKRSQKNEKNDFEKEADNEENLEPVYAKILPKIRSRNLPNQTDNTEELFNAKVEELKALPLHELRARMLKEGVLVGPLDTRNRYLYEKKLAKVLLKQEQEDLSCLEDKFGDVTVSEGKYSRQLERLLNLNDPATMDIGLKELAIVNDFFEKAQISGSTYFVYLLLDPRALNESPTFSEFVDSVFYIGKGINSRSHFHLYEAIKFKNDPKGKENRKCQRIIDIWNAGRGVIVLHPFSNVNSDHALIYEGAIIASVGKSNLSNIRGGDFKPPTDRFTQREKEALGARLIYNSYCIFGNTIKAEITEAKVVIPKSP